MNATPEQQKAELRQRIRNALRNLSPADRLAGSIQVCTRLQQEPVWREATWVLLYSPLPDELDVLPLLRDALSAGKRLALPRFDPVQNIYLACHVMNLNADLRAGHFGGGRAEGPTPAAEEGREVEIRARRKDDGRGDRLRNRRVVARGSLSELQRLLQDG